MAQLRWLLKLGVKMRYGIPLRNVEPQQYLWANVRDSNVDHPNAKYPYRVHRAGPGPDNGPAY